MRSFDVGLGAFSYLLAVSLTVAIQAGGAAADDHLAGPASALPLSTLRLNVPSDLPQAEEIILDPTLKLSSRGRANERHLITFERCRVSANTSLHAIANKVTLATDPAMAASPSTCDESQWL
jgi:hypothetical protein